MTVTLYVVDLPEFAPIVAGAQAVPGSRLTLLSVGYWKVQTDHELKLHRKELGLGPALWNTALSGGFRGRIQRYDRDELHIVSDLEGPAS